jgi:hypothetical protein
MTEERVINRDGITIPFSRQMIAIADFAYVYIFFENPQVAGIT